MQFQETCPAGAEQCFSWPASSLTTHPDALRCLEKPKAHGRGLFPAGLPSLGLAKLWRKQRERPAYRKTFAKRYSHTSMCTPVKMLRTWAWRHPAQAVRGGWQHLHTCLSLDIGCGGVLAFILGRAWLPSSRSTSFSTPVLVESSTVWEAQMLNYMQKVQKQGEYKSFGNKRPSVQVYLGNL